MNKSRTGSLYLIHKLLFFVLVLIIPLNLGKHFIIRDSYVGGLLVDYLIPTVYLQDILIVAMLLFWILDIKLSGFRKLLEDHLGSFRLLLLFLVSVGLSVISSQSLYPSLYAYLRLILYAMFFLYVLGNFCFEYDFVKIVRSLFLAVLLLGILAFFQWAGQSSVFENYLFFGEQPYSTSTVGIAVEDVFGVAKIPVYGLFRHPNIFGGFLAVVLLWLLYIKTKRISWRFVFILGSIALLLTISQVAWLAYLLGLLFFWVVKKFGKKGVVFSVLITLLIAFLAISIPYWPKDTMSVIRRSNLEVSSIESIKEFPLFGVGLNNFVVVVEENLPKTQVLRFPQPVHNIFLLMLVESGIFSLIFFVGLIAYAVYTLLKQKFGIPAFLFVSLLQFVILGSFDHYLLTIHQTQILIWLTLGMALAYNQFDEK